VICSAAVITPDCEPGNSGETKPPGTGWLLIVLRFGLALGMICQLLVLSDLNKTIRIGATRVGGIPGAPVLSAALAILAAPAWSAALLWGRSAKATIASVIGCLLAWSYYAATLRWSYFAAHQHGLLYLLPFFPWLFVATGVTLRDAYVAGGQATAAGLRTLGFEAKSKLGFTKELEETKLFVPAVYAMTAVILLLHRPLFLFSRRIAFVLAWTLRGKPWTHHFTWLPVASGLGLALAAGLRSARRALAGQAGLSASVLGCVYGALVLHTFSLEIEMERRSAQQFGTKVSGDILDWVLVAASFVPVLVSFVFAARDAAKGEPMRNVVVRITAALCFAAMVIFAQDLGLEPRVFQIYILCFAVAYLFCALHPVFLTDYALGTSLGQAFLVLALFKFVLQRGLVLSAELWVIAGANVLLVLVVLLSVLGGGRLLWSGRIVAGFALAVGFATLLFFGLFFLPWSFPH